MGEPAAARDDLRSFCRGALPLDGELEAWQRELLANPAPLNELVGEGQSAVNVVDPGPMEANGAELQEAAAAAGVSLRIFFARKANKCLSLVDRARELGYGIDVASLEELAQVCERGFDGPDVVVTAAVKPRSLLELALDRGATAVLDNADELRLLSQLTAERRQTGRVALRLAVELADRTPTRFGLGPSEAVRTAAQIATDPRLELVGLHFHLDGYSAEERARAVAEALAVADQVVAGSPELSFIDIGGGIPMSYLTDRKQWEAFWAAHRSALLGRGAPITFENHGLGLTAVGGVVDGRAEVYPYWQRPIRGAWLSGLLEAQITAGGARSTVAAALGRRGLELRCEPGRSLLDGCGLTAARVHFVKRRADGEALIGLGMNRTQCRSTSADFMVDPLLVAVADAAEGPALDGYLVGAYCIERELISLRRMRFPHGVAVGDLVVIPNTAGYLMHILESSSHQMPLAANYLHRDGELTLDPINSLRSRP